MAKNKVRQLKLKKISNFFHPTGSSTDKSVVLLQRFVRKRQAERKQLLIDNGSYYAKEPPFPSGSCAKGCLWPMCPTVLRKDLMAGMFWEWCVSAASAASSSSAASVPYNNNVNRYHTPYYYLATVHARTSLENKLNYILEGTWVVLV